MVVLLILVILAAVAFLCSLSGRTGHPGLNSLQGWSYAHRGLHGPGIPENSMAAFRGALDGGYGIELDVHLLKDGALAVIHDSLLNRTTGQPGRVEDLTAQELKNYRLEGSEETIPQLQDVLALYAGKAPLIIELKPVDDNHALLSETACRMLENYRGPWCMESFDPRCLRWLKKNRPDVIRGQLTENYFRSRNDLPDVLKFLLTHNMLNFLSRPDFIAYRFSHRKDTVSNQLCRKLWRLQGVSWTLKTKEEYDAAVSEGWLPIFEGFRP